MGELGVEPVVGQERHLHQLFRLPVGQAEPVVEQRGADAEHHRQIIRWRFLAEDARVDRRVGRSALLGWATGHQAADLVGQLGQRVSQLLSAVGDDGEGGHQSLRGDGDGGDTRLVRSLERHISRRRRAGGGRAVLRRTPGQRRADTDRRTGAQRPGDEITAADAGSRRLRAHCRFSTPATCDTFSDSPASWALSVSTVCWSTVTSGQRGDGNWSFSVQYNTQPSP